MAWAGDDQGANEFYNREGAAAAGSATACSRCDDKKMLPIVYGSASSDMVDLSNKGVIKLGGAYPKDGKPAPLWYCVKCDAPI
jgi:hypothetical protein